MENFFYETEFCADIESFVGALEWNGIYIDELSDSWSVRVELASLDKMFTLDMGFVVDAISNKTDYFDDRFPEDSDRLFKQIEDAVRQSVDLDKLNSLIPSLYYPNGTFATITKQDLIDWQA